MRISIGQRVLLGFAVALAVLLIIGGVSYRNLVQLNADNRWVAHTIEVMESNERLLTRLIDSANLSRAFTLSGTEDFRQRFNANAAAIPAELGLLRRLTSDNPAQQDRVRQLEALIDTRLQAARGVMALRESVAADKEAQIAARTLEETRAMDGIRQVFGAIGSEEQRLLTLRQTSAAGLEDLTKNTLLYGTAVAFALVGLVAFLVLRGIRQPLGLLIESATKIGAGDYAQRVLVDSNDEIGRLATEFNRMAAQIEQRQTALAAQDWLNTHLAKFATIFEGQRVRAKLCEAVLNELARVVNARHSVIYVPEADGAGVILKCQASYAHEAAPAELKPGQSLVGQAFNDQQMLVLRDVPRDYIKINSALGAATPANLVVLPAVFDGQVRAVLELATFNVLDEIKISFLRRLGESFGIVLNSIAAVVKTEELLSQAQALSARLEAGQRELNERNHELQAQSERLRESERMLQQQQIELKQSNEELEQSNEELQQTNAEMEDKQVLLEEQKLAVDAANREVSEARAELEEKVRQLDLTSKYKSEFLANMSHELRTPLNSLLILSKVLADNADGNLTEKQIQRAQAIHSSGSDLLELINDILDLSKIEAGSMDLDVDDLQLTDLKDFIDKTFRHMVEGKGLAFGMEFGSAVPAQMRTDVRRLQQVLKNLLANACKFTTRGSVKLKVSLANGGWQGANPALDSSSGVLAFAVTDTGIGIPADRQQIIFDAFQQGDAGTARKYGGTGLGLSISRELTRLLGGALTLQSTENVGSVFTLYLPINGKESSKQAEAPGAPAIPAPVRTPARAPREVPVTAGSDIPTDDRDNLQSDDRVLLVIEDDTQFAAILAEFAHDKGFKVLYAGTAEEGIALARRFKPTAITLDLRLPDNDGWVVLDRLKHDPETRHIPLHVISVEEQRERGLRQGAVSYLQKPVSADAIQRALSSTIDFVNRRVKNLLIVEDDPAQRQGILDIIGNGDVLPVAVGTAAEALAALEKERFDCIVIDLGLPDMPGARLIEEIHRRMGEQSPPIVIYTGKELTRKEESELRRMSDAIIVKDVSSPQRLLAETALFLHRVQSKLPESKRRLIEMIRKDDPLLSNRKVLVVDDDVRNIFAITAALESHNMDVLHAENGQAGIEVLKNAPQVDVILMDIMMPEMDGYETIRRIRADDRFKKVPIIAVTAKAMKGDRELCLQAGASDYITKPVDMDQLRSLLRVWLYR